MFDEIRHMSCTLSINDLKRFRNRSCVAGGRHVRKGGNANLNHNVAKVFGDRANREHARWLLFVVLEG